MIKTRFAPSPTGVLHVGGARTALFCWLFSKKMGGRFVLRIEDTDLARSTPESVQAILDGMDWLGLDYDEGPYYQTQRFERYTEVIGQLMQQGDAYYCECSRERLAGLRATQLAAKQKPRYDGRCRDLGLSAGASTVVRFKNPLQGEVCFVDQVKGKISVANAELDDLIIARSDRSPTYNLTVVVDDLDMQITHVIRGDDHVNNTPRQINLLLALGAALPEYAHLPMILGDDGKRLSKRHGAVGVMEYRDSGYLPQALLNYLVRLGWSYGDQEVFTRNEMIEHFSLAGINRSASTFNTEKLNWVNQQYMMNEPLEDLVDLVKQRLQQAKINCDEAGEFSAMIDLYRQRTSTLGQLVDSIRYCFEDFDRYDEKAARRALTSSALEALRQLRQQLSELESWDRTSIHRVIENIVETLGVAMGKVGQPLRVAVTGASFSPPIDQTVEILGRARTLRRIERAINFIRAQNGKTSSNQ